MIQIPKLKFSIGNTITEKEINERMYYVIYDISYSLADKKWYYRYKYWEGGYEHYCKSLIEYVEANFEVVK